MLDLILDILGVALLLGQAAYFLIFADLSAGGDAYRRSVIPMTGRGFGDGGGVI